MCVCVLCHQLQLEREGAIREGLLAGRGDEVSALVNAQHSAAAQMSQYIMDLQAFERQVW